MSEGSSKNFKVPRIRRNESKDNLRQIDPKSRDARELEKVISRSYVGSNYKSPWDMKSVVLVENRELEERYRQKKQEMKDEGRRDLSDQYAFMVLRDNMVAMSVAKEGLRCRDIPFNSLGDSKLGVYVCRHADIQLRMADLWGIKQCALVIFKVTLGKCKVIAGTGEERERIEPTPNFDCHVSQYQPRPSDSRYLQLARSQVYLYEYDDDCLPATIPRQCLPYAILLYDKVESVTASISEPVDSYSKRPVPVSDKSKAAESSSTEKAPETDPKTAGPKMETESGLCVPRLTAGPPPGDPHRKPSDPRMRPTDPRLQTGPGSTYQPQFGPTEEELEKEMVEEFVFPPRQKHISLPPINLPPIITDTRITRADPRLDPRLRDQSKYNTQDASSVPSSSVGDRSAPRSRFGKSDDGTGTTRKKLSLTDYKKKVGVVPLEKSEPKLSVAEQSTKSGSIYDSLRTTFYSAEPDYNSFQAPYKPQTPFSKPPSVTPSDTSQSREMELADAVKEPAEEKKDGHAYPHEDIVDKPDDMMKTLNELSDPDDISQSPKVPDEPDEEDPSLAEAMKKLVEYSGNVSLFTEALRSLQESAEEMGDVLTDPEFLVKKIAETIDNLAKSESSQEINVEESPKAESSVNQAQRKSTSVTVSDDMRVHHSPEQKPRGVLSADSPMAKAMQSTLAELREAERARELFKGESYPYDSSTRDSKAEVKATEGILDIDKIPLPPMDVERSQLRKKSNLDVSNIPLPTFEKTPSKVEKSYKSEDMTKGQRKERSKFSSDWKNDQSIEEIASEKEEITDKDHRKPSQNIIESVSGHKRHEYASDLCDDDKTVSFVKEVDPLEQDQDYRESAFWKQASEAWDTASQQGRGEKAKNKERTTDPFDIAEESDNADIPLDKDERFVRNSNSFENIKEVVTEKQIVEDIFCHDRDERSHSRSLSPQTINSAFMDKDDRFTDKNDMYSRKDEKQPETKLDFSDPFGLGLEDRDERIPRTEHSLPVPVAENKDSNINMSDPRINRRDPRLKGTAGQTNSTAGQTNRTVQKSVYDKDDSNDSSDSPILFDAYTMGKSKSSSEKTSDLTTSEREMRVSDDFGDVDWRTAAASEMGDVDLRASSSQDSQISSQHELSDIRHSQDVDFRKSASVGQAGPEQNASYTNVAYDKYYNTRPDSHVNPRDFGNMHDQDALVKTVAGSYSTNTANYDSYSSAPVASYNSATQYGGEYKSSSGAVYSDPYSYSTSNRPPELYQGASGVGPPNFPPSGGHPNFPPSGGHPNFPPSGGLLNFPPSGGPQNFPPSGGPQNFPPSGGPLTFPPSGGPPNLPPGGIQNLMHNVDVSSLKNILASVQLPSIPVVPPVVPPSPSKPEINPPRTDPATDSDDDDDRTDNQPAFCTGLSFLKSKQTNIDVSRPKYSGKAIIPDYTGPPPPKNMKGFGKNGKKAAFDGRNKSRPGFDQSKPDGPGSKFNFNKTGDTRPGMFTPLFVRPAGSQGIPGFDLPESSSKDKEPSATQPFQFSEAIPDRDISTGSYQEPSYFADGRINYNGPRRRDPDRKHSDGENKDLDSTPKDKSGNRNDTTNTESWQNAILESMEQSALKIRSEDSIITDIDTPVKETKCAKSLFDTEKSNDKSEGDKMSVKRTHEKEEEKADVKVARMSKSQSSMEQDSDDEEAALVIDLSPTSKKESQSDNSQQDKSSSQPSTASVDAGDSSVEMADCIIIDDELSQKASKDEEVHSEDEMKKGKAVLEEDEDITSTTDVKSLMEKRRKKIVIKLKGQTKIVDPKTGKAYTENLTGSAIQVLGQPPPRAAPPLVQPKREPPQPIQKIQGISTIGSGSKSNLMGGGGRGKYRSPSPVNQTFVSSASVPARGRSQSPVNQISAIGQQPSQTHEYIHPYTGKKMVYGHPNQPNIPQSVPIIGQKPALINVGVGNAGTPTIKVPLLPSPPASALISPPFVVVPGQLQRPGMPVFNVQPRVLRPGIVSPLSVPAVSQVQPQLLLQPAQMTGMAIQTLGTANKPPIVPIQEVKKEKNDVFDWFSDKFKKRENEDRSSSTVSNYEFNSANKVIKTEPEYDSCTRRNNVEIKIQSDNESDRKRQGSEGSDYSSESKRPRTRMSDSSVVVKIETENTSQSGASEGRNDNKTDQGDTTKEVDTAASSELEDGEISDDSQEMDQCPPAAYQSDSGYTGYSGRVDNQPVQSIPTVGSYGGAPVERFTNRPHRAASEWSELLQSPTKQSIERVRATRIESKSLIENNDLLSKSAASITKTKQKIMARSQVRTLGDWLKVELENDNIQPLQNIIPYSLNTDLSIIPKQRRRKIRLKVKNAIEQVGNKKPKVEQPPPQEEASSNPVIQTDYSPEVESDQVGMEVALVRKISTGLKEKLRSTKMGMTIGNQNTSLIGAFATVESEMRTLMQRTCFYGYPNRRVPNELLLESEMNSFLSDIDGTFLILMMPISSKPYFKLLQMKYDLGRLHKELETSSDPEATRASITELQMQRQNLLRSFTGYLNKRRLQRIQEQVDKYTTVYDYFKNQPSPVPDSKLKFIRTTQMDLRQHLILTKQHMANEDQKYEI